VKSVKAGARVLVLGGGISGLLAAWHLQRRGHVVEVWEAAATAGGWVQTLSWPGPQGEPGWFERGPQSLRVGRGSALEGLLQDLDVAFHPSGPRGPRWLGKGGRRQPSPTTLTGLLRAPGLGLGDKLRLLGEPFAAASPGEESLHAFFTRRLGGGFARELLPALVAGVLAAPPEQIAVEALPRLRRLEARGGLLLGGLRVGAERTRQLVGGTGALTQALAFHLDSVSTDRTARTLEPLPEGRWRVQGDGFSTETSAVVVALPSRAAAALLAAVVPEAAALLAAIPRLDLRVWHSRHAMVRGWERGPGLLIHPPEGRGLLGVVSLAADDPRGVPGLLQLRTYVGGGHPVAPALASWPGVFGELRRWLPELRETIQVHEEPCPGAFPLLEPGHSGRVRAVLGALPPHLHWLGTERFGPGVADLAEGIQAWADTAPL